MGEQVTIYLQPQMRDDAEAGRHNFLSKVVNVLRSAGFEVVFADENERQHHKGGKALVHMWPPMNTETLVLRRVYAYPFWAIEMTDQRWEWDVARAEFEPKAVPAKKAERFAMSWRKRMFSGVETARDGYIYIPLQGRVLEKRNFQSAAPLEMIEATLAADARPVVIGLHPKERYSATEVDALEKFEQRFNRVSIVMGQMERYLPRCDYVVSENSAAAFFGYFFNKPAALFARIDFHHIAANVSALGVKEALWQVPDMQPDFEKYLWWFWQEHCINAGRPEAEAQIKARFSRHGWLK